MTRPKKRRTGMTIPPHKRTPSKGKNLTRAARQLYDLVYAFGLGGCWMSNLTIAEKTGLCTRTIQRARQHLVKKQIIVTARTCPHTWIMWSRYHRAVQNCQVLLYPVRQEMDNPYFEIDPQPVGVTKQASRGDKMSPKLDVKTLTSLEEERRIRKPAKDVPVPVSSRGSASNSASSSGSTSNQLISENSGGNSDLPESILGKISPELDKFGILLFKQEFEKFRAIGWTVEISIAWANDRALRRRTKNTI